MSDDRQHDPALQLLRDLDPKVALTPQARRRIADRIEAARSRSRSRRWLWLAAPCAAAIALFVAHATKAPPPTAARTLTQTFVVPACAVTRVADGDGFTAALVGPADAQVGGLGRRTFSLRSGRLIVRATNGAVEIVAPDSRITLAPSSFAEVEVRLLGQTRVAAYRGEVRVQVASTRATLAVPAGSAWNGTEVRQTSAGESEQATEVLAPSTGHVRVCPAPTEPAATVPESKNLAPPSAERAKKNIPRRSEPHSAVATVEPSAPLPTAPPQAPTNDAHSLAEAIRILRVDHDAKAALALLDGIPRAGTTTFADEIALVRIEALLDLGHHAAALTTLDGLPLPDVPRGEELLVLRGDLRAEAQRWREAIVDYTRGVEATSSQIAERSLFGRAVCRQRLGESWLARADFRDYLQRFPSGPFAARARRLLDQ